MRPGRDAPSSAESRDIPLHSLGAFVAYERVNLLQEELNFVQSKNVQIMRRI